MVSSRPGASRSSVAALRTLLMISAWRQGGAADGWSVTNKVCASVLHGATQRQRDRAPQPSTPPGRLDEARQAAQVLASVLTASPSPSRSAPAPPCRRRRGLPARGGPPALPPVPPGPPAAAGGWEPRHAAAGPGPPRCGGRRPGRPCEQRGRRGFGAHPGPRHPGGPAMDLARPRDQSVWPASSPAGLAGGGERGLHGGGLLAIGACRKGCRGGWAGRRPPIVAHTLMQRCHSTPSRRRCLGGCWAAGLTDALVAAIAPA